MAKHENDQEIRNELLRSYCSKTVKDLTDADVKFLATIIKPSFKFDADAYYPIRNPYTGMSLMVKGYMHSILAFINEMMAHYPNWNDVAVRWGCTKGNAQSNFDRARILVLKLDSKIYANFID